MQQQLAFECALRMLTHTQRDVPKDTGIEYLVNLLIVLMNA